jgi:opacity protein-like surface antigen
MVPALPGGEIESELRQAVQEKTMRLARMMIATAAFAVFLSPALNLGAQEAAMPYSARANLLVPRFDLFLGYSYLRAVPTLAEGNRLAWLNGGSTSIAYNFNSRLGLVADFGGYNDTQLHLSGATPSSVANSRGTVFTYLLGPRLSFRGQDRFTPFAQVLLGGVHASAVTISSICTGNGCTLLPSESNFALTAGGGLDLNLRRHLAIRMIQAEYLMTDLEDHSTGKSATQNDIRLSAGVVFRFGGSRGQQLPPPSPLTYSCSVKPTVVFPGDTIAASGTAVNLNPNKTATYTWSVDGGTVVGLSDTANVRTANIAPGAYTLKSHVSEGSRADENADCTAQYVVKAFDPPTVNCSASPSSVISGDPSTITAIGTSPQSRPLIYSYSTTYGSVSGAGTTAILSTSGAPVGTITATCNAADDKGQVASSTASVTVIASPIAVKPMTSELCSISFARDARRPARVDNEAKACLDGVALNLQRSSAATLGLVGNAGLDEKDGVRIAAERAVNTKAYLVKEKGIDPTRIAVYTGTHNQKAVSATLIPVDAIFDPTGDLLVK